MKVGSTFIVGPFNSFLDRTATASSTYSSGYEAGKAVDGNLGTRWASVDPDAGAWLSVKLRRAKKISQFGLGTYFDTNAYLKDFTISGSNNGIVWTPIGSGQHSNSATVEIFTFTNPSSYVYYRVLTTSVNWHGGDAYSVNEFQGYDID